MKSNKKVYKPRRKKTMKKMAVSKSVKEYINKAIHRNVENKEQLVQWSQVMGGYASSNTLYAFPMTPYIGGISITQGVTQGTRVGNQIKPRSLHWNFVLTQRPYDAASNPAPQPINIEIYICSLKAVNELPTNFDINTLYQYGATSLAPSGQVVDTTLNINKDIFTCHRRLRYKLGWATSGGTGTNAGYQAYTNNDYKLGIFEKLDLTKYCPKTIDYNDNSNVPTSKCVFALVNIMPATGGTAFGAGITPVRMDGHVHLIYEDA